MAHVGRLVAVLLGLLAAAGWTVTFSSAETLDQAFNRGIARSARGWVVSGPAVIARLDEGMKTVQRVDDAIPASWKRRGFVHIGDVDVAGTTLYVPFEQPDFARGKQAMARYDAATLRFRDATVVDQHENAFVAIDGDSGIAYSMDRSGGDALLRYDVRAGWRRLTPLRLDRALAQVTGAAVARNAVWLVADDVHHGLYRVDIGSGAVTDLGSVPPPGGESKGIDAASVASGDLHATVSDTGGSGITLDHFRVSGEPGALATPGTDTSWPPALTYFAIALLVAAVGAVGTVFYRARTTLHPKR
jgi:hypothetical protein